MSEIPFVPILRQGEVYQSLDVHPLKAVDGETPAAHLGMANSGMVKRDLYNMGKAREALRKFSCAQLLEITKKAGDYFLKDALPVGIEGDLQTPEDYINSLSLTSGLPHALIRMNMERLHNVFQEVDVIITGLTRGLDLEVLDRGYGEQGGSPVSFTVQTDALGVIMPSNSPAVNALWLPCITLKVPIVIKPGREEPWTPWRIIQAFIKAGAPPEAFSFYPTDHEGSGAIIRRCGRVLLFGDDSTVAQHVHDPRIEVHGTGHSKVLLGEDQVDHWKDHLDVMVESISANSGRSCICTSTVVTPRHGDAIAKAIAERLAEIRPLAPDDPKARLSGFANPKFAEYITGAIDRGLEAPGARDVSAEVRGGECREVSLDCMNYLLPTVVRVDSFEHELANREFLFPYASVVEVPQKEMLGQIGHSLVVTAITKDLDWIGELLDAPHIDRINLGPVPTNRVQWNQPHEGNLFEFLYKRRSFSLANA